MAFPANPTNGQQHTEGSRLYSWDGYAWSLVSNVSTHAATHASGGSDAITPAAIGAASLSHTHSAADLASGTVDIAHLPARVRAAVNVFNWSSFR